ncbi:MAG: hypothetical protein H6Q58_726 [Firmicutes bacterium]|nr:hypothetical protein [Bacillota bacterium]
MFLNFRKSKQYDYIYEFNRLSQFSIQAAEFLDSTMKAYNRSEMPAKIREMHEIEHAADVEKKEMHKVLIKEFLPPIEKDDIIRLSHEIDNVTDSIEDVLIAVDIFAVETIYPEIIEFTELIADCCMHMNLVLAELKDYKNSTLLFEQMEQVNLHKSRGKALYVSSLRNLCKVLSDPVDIMAYSEIYIRLQDCCENCKIVTNTAERIVMKNL